MNKYEIVSRHLNYLLDEKGLSTVRIKWYGRDGHSEENEVSIIRLKNNCKELYLTMEKDGVEQGYPITYDDIQEIGYLPVSCETNEFFEDVEDVDSFIKIDTDVIGFNDDLVEMSHVANVLQRLIEQNGFYSEVGKKVRFTNDVRERDWFIRLPEFVKACYDCNKCFQISERMGFTFNGGDSKAGEWRRRLYWTVSKFILSNYVNDNDKNVLNVLLPHLKSNRHKKNKITQIQNLGRKIKNFTEVNILCDLMFSEYDKSDNIFKPHGSNLENYKKYIDLKLENVAYHEISKILGIPLRTLYGWTEKTKKNIKCFRKYNKNEKLNVISEKFGCF